MTSQRSNKTFSSHTAKVHQFLKILRSSEQTLTRSANSNRFDSKRSKSSKPSSATSSRLFTTSVATSALMMQQLTSTDKVSDAQFGTVQRNATVTLPAAASTAPLHWLHVPSQYNAQRAHALPSNETEEKALTQKDSPSPPRKHVRKVHGPLPPEAPVVAATAISLLARGASENKQSHRKPRKLKRLAPRASTKSAPAQVSDSNHSSDPATTTPTSADSSSDRSVETKQGQAAQQRGSRRSSLRQNKRKRKSKRAQSMDGRESSQRAVLRELAEQHQFEDTQRETRKAREPEKRRSSTKPTVVPPQPPQQNGDIVLNRMESAPIAPFVEASDTGIQNLLDAANIKPGDVLFDLGCGKGELCVRAAQQFGVKVVGIEMRPWLAAAAHKRAQHAGVSHLVTIVCDDIRNVDLSSATVVVVYMVGGALTLLRSQFEKQLRPGCRFVSLLFAVPTWSTLEEQQQMREREREREREQAADGASESQGRGRAWSRRMSGSNRDGSQSQSQSQSESPSRSRHRRIRSASTSRSRSRSRANSTDEPSQESKLGLAAPVRVSRSPSPAMRSLSRRERSDKPRRGLFVYVMGQHMFNNASSNHSSRGGSASRTQRDGSSAEESKNSRKLMQLADSVAAGSSEHSAAAIGASSALPPRSRRPASAAVSSRTKSKLPADLLAATLTPSARDPDNSHLSQTLRWIEELLAHTPKTDETK